MYFVTDEHKNNFEMLVEFYKAEQDLEYKSACYVLALPEIYNKVNGKFGERPFDWMYKFEEKEVEEDFWTKEKRIVIDRVYELDENGEELESQAYGYLSSGYRKIVQLAQNLFNSSNEFNLCDALGTWGDDLFQVYQQAVLLRAKRQES